MKKRKVTGRPSTYTPELALQICEQIAGGTSLRKVCAQDGMPDKTTVLRWLLKNEDFRTQYTHAREMQADCFVDEIVDIADTTEQGVIITEKPDGVETKYADMIEHRRLRIEARKWTAAKMRPKKYGDKIVNEHTGEDGGPINHSIAVEFVEPAGTDEESEE